MTKRGSSVCIEWCFYALAKEVRDDDLKRRILEKLYHLTAIS
jgi:hypothetical protein